MPGQLQSTQRNPGIDLARGLAALGVILLHTIHHDTLVSTGVIFLVQPVPVFCFLLGTNLAISASRRKLRAIDLLAPRFLATRLSRLLVPLSIVALLTILLNAVLGEAGIRRPWLHVLAGLPPIVTGPGDYFIAVYWQFLWISPLLLWGRRKPLVLLSVCVVLDLAFQLVMTKTAGGHASYWFYRASVARYLTVIAAGVALARTLESPTHEREHYHGFCKSLTSVLIAAVGAVGALMAYFQFYAGFVPFFGPWNGHNLLTFGFPIATTCGIVRLRCRATQAQAQLLTRPFEILGRASLHIFLIQMLYFHRVAPLWSFVRDDQVLYVTVALAIIIPASLALWQCDALLRRISVMLWKRLQSGA